jgi:ribosomal protein S18 acetylase RimI-like enzyme
MSPEDASPVRFRELTAADLPAVTRLATEAFAAIPFYRRVLGFNGVAFEAYWREFLPWVVQESSVHVFGLDRAGRLLGLLVLANHRFPPMRSGAGFLRRLAGRIGFRGLLRYLRFVIAYEHLMRRQPEESSREARGLWLVIAPRGAAVGLGRRLVREAMAAVRPEGRTLITGLVDGGNRRLMRFYQRIGFTVSEPVRLCGASAATIELRGEPEEVSGRC